MPEALPESRLSLKSEDRKLRERLLWLAGNAAKLGFGDTVGLAKGADLVEGLRVGS